MKVSVATLKTFALSLLISIFAPSFYLTAAESESTLQYGETGHVNQFNPYTVHELSGKRIMQLIFEGLIAIDHGNNYIPALAEKWDISPSKDSVRFALKKNVFWHTSEDGKHAGKKIEFTAKDVEKTIELFQSPASEIANPAQFQMIKSAEILGDHFIEIKLTQSFQDPLRFLTFKIIPSHMYENQKMMRRTDQFNTSPVGTGPYKLARYNRTGEVLLQANKDYHGQAPQLENIIMKVYTDQSIMAQSLMYKSIDLVTYVSGASLPEIKSDNSLRLVPYDSLSYSFLALNNKNTKLADITIRNALSYSINRSEMIDSFFNSQGRIISGPFPPTSWAYNLDVEAKDFDKTKAMALFNGAGYTLDPTDSTLKDKSGNPLEFNFSIPVTGESELVKRLVLAMQSYLSEVGVRVKLEFMDWLVWKERVLKDRNYDITLASWNFDDSADITSLFHSSHIKEWGNNFVSYSNPKVDSLLMEGKYTNSFDRKKVIYQNLHKIIAEESPYIFLWNLKNHAALSKNIKGYEIEPIDFFRNIANWKKDSTKM